MQWTLPPWWIMENDMLKRVYVFQNFLDAIQFIDSVAPICESSWHHPDWRNIYNRIEVALTTHDAWNIVTEKDFLLAKSMEEIFTRVTN
jgi:4a-hydroxytetrahydrobiopterin dehydratase